MAGLYVVPSSHSEIVEPTEEAPSSEDHPNGRCYVFDRSQQFDGGTTYLRDAAETGARRHDGRYDRQVEG